MAQRRTRGKREKKAPIATQSPVSAVDFAHPGFTLDNGEIERGLITGEHAGALKDYFGEANYQELHDLAREASRRSARGGPRILILPGIMGSRLGKPGFNLEHIIWLNPVAILAGEVDKLRLNAAMSPYTSVGVILLAYLRMKLVLRLHGFEADFHDYDWRQSIDSLGQRLADRLKQEPASEIYLVAHSMGGLVARAALKRDGKKVARLIMLGTPNCGSFAPVQVLRASYDVVQKIAGLDFRHNAEQLCDTVFNTFPGLYDMLPYSGKSSSLNLFKRSTWPSKGPQPLDKLLQSASDTQSKLAAYDDRFFLIAGINQDTVTDIALSQGEFSYAVSKDGDGTVPLRFARLENMPDSHVYYVEESHGSLPNNGTVEHAVRDLITSGITTALSNERPQPSREVRAYSEHEMKERLQTGPPRPLGSSDFRHVLDCVAAPDARDRGIATVAKAGAAAAGVSTFEPSAGKPSFHDLLIGRRRQKRLEVTIAHGSLIDADARAYVLGMFRNVIPSGAARAIDDLLGGAISDFTARRMFAGEPGEIFAIPVGRKVLGADMVVFAGLGSFDQYTAEIQQLAAENVIRVLARTGVQEFATVLMGAGSGSSTGALLESLVIGFLRGLRDTQSTFRFRGITLCETDSTRYEQMKSELLRLATTTIFDDVEVVFDEIELPHRVQPTTAARGFRRDSDPVYLIVRNEAAEGADYSFRSSVLSAGSKAAVMSGIKDVSHADVDKLLATLDTHDTKFTVEAVEQFGTKLAKTVLADEIRAVLQNLRDHHLVVVHDAAASRFPWETLQVDGAAPALNGGLSRRYLADNLPLAGWLEQRRQDGVVTLLLVIDPTEDLEGARKEAQRIREIAASMSNTLKLTELIGAEATRLRVRDELRSGKYDVLHYAGHAFFDAGNPGSSGLTCAKGEVLTGADITGIGNLPSLVFFNACEAARTRGMAKKSATARQTAGLAESLLRGGIANFMGTYWPVDDDAAAAFASTFYKALLEPQPLGAAILSARNAVRALSPQTARDWADYVLYGSYDFLLEELPQS